MLSIDITIGQEKKKETSNVEKMTENTRLSPWGNDTILLSEDQVLGLITGEKYYYFDGEYGHEIRMVK